MPENNRNEEPDQEEYDKLLNQEDPYLQKHTGKPQDNLNLTSDKIADTNNVHISNMFDDFIYADLIKKNK